MPSQPGRKTKHDGLVDRAVAEHGVEIVAVFRTVQEERGHLPLTSSEPSLRFSKSPMRMRSVSPRSTRCCLRSRKRRIFRVCDSPACRLKGGADVRKAIEAAAGSEWTVERSSCLGLCDRAPAALVEDQACGPLTLGRAGDALRGWRGDHPTYAEPLPGEERVTMARIGKIDPDSIENAIAAGAYQALKKALSGPPTDVITIVETAGVQGRGGAGFPVGKKWKFVAETKGSQKYVVCNFDESEPGTFKDRVLGDGDPHLLLEGMALGAYAVGANSGYIYIRGEYGWIAERLERAIAQAEEHGWLGNNIQGSGFSFTVRMHRGAGAYICGEETALLESLEGRRGEPRLRPPYPTINGYLGKPTVVNNVESFCTVPAIVHRGADWYRSMGTSNSPGVKVFTVCGDVNRPCAFEAPYGITLRQIIDRFGGGMRQGSKFKMALTGGAAGTIVPASMLDVALDGASWRQGIGLGSGAMFILDTSVSAVTLLYWLLQFFEFESCGKCTPCREGSRETRILVERIANGQGRMGDAQELERLAAFLGTASFCGLGQSVAMPVESALRHFGQEFGRKKDKG